ncbi:MAG: LON peptidase substrate-binding domain-containing protein [Bacteroidales bacterium]|nr:LON peptidase substrate-binding domain-containing protein [Bacteroidales bacterium]
MTRNKIRNIPLFPLNICLFPGEDLPLKIFEPRYKQLINDTVATNSTFGIPFVLKNKIQNFGTEVKINQIVAKNTLGEMVIMIEGFSNFSLTDYDKNYKDKLYSGGRILEVKPGGEITDQELIKSIYYYAEIVNTNFLKDLKPDLMSSDTIARAFNLSPEDKFRYISMNSQKEKEKFIRFNLDTLYKLSEQERLLNKDYSLN